MAKILISEPHDDICALLEVVVRRLGHEPVMLGEGEQAPNVDSAVIEPAGADGLRLARELRDRGIPVVFASIYPAGRDSFELAPFAYLVKPFPLHALERALTEALAAAAVEIHVAL